MSTEIFQLDDFTLLKTTKSLAIEERRISIEIIHHLQEIFKRRLHLFRGYSSLFEYTVQELGYSEAAAGRRLAAMKLLTDVPEVEEKIKKGELTLTVAAQAQRLFHAEEKNNHPVSVEQKKAILESLTHKSTRAAEQTLIQHSSQPLSIQKPDKIKPITSTQSEVRFIADQSLIDQLDLIKGLLANKFPQLAMAELIGEMAKISLEKLQPKSPKLKKIETQAYKIGPVYKETQIHNEIQTTTSGTVNETQAQKSCGAAVKLPELNRESQQKGRQTNVLGTQSRYIPVEVKREVFHRDQGKCQYVDAATGRKCGSTRALQYEHKRPYAVGGNSTVDNLEILCRSHNLTRAVYFYGETKISAHIKTNDER